MGNRQHLEVSVNTAVIYARYSSHNQREESIDAQIRACREYANREGLQVIEAYTDSAKTGTNAEREAFQRMIADSGKKLFRYVIVHKLDRFGREMFDFVTYEQVLVRNGVRLLSATESFDDSPQGKLVKTFMQGMAQFYSQNLALEVMKGMKESAYKCTHLGGVAPLGYDVDPVTKQYVVNEREAKIVRTIFDKYADGAEGYNQILNYLNGMGYLTKRSEPFGKNSLNSILKNEKYVGRFTFNKKQEKDVCGKRNPQVNPRDEWIVVEDGMPAIIDKAIFDKVQVKMQHNLKNGGKFRAREMYLLSGLIVCGECGSSMTGNTRLCGRGKIRYSSYRCSYRLNHKGCDKCGNKEVRREYLENYVLDELYHTLFSDRSIKKLTAMLNDYNRKMATESGEELIEAEKALREVNRKIGTIIRLVSESGISIDTVRGELKSLEDSKKFMEGRIREMSLGNNASMITEETIGELIDRSREFVKTRNIPECRNFIESYVEKVIVYADHVEVRFKVHVPGAEEGSISPLTSTDMTEAIKREYKNAM